MGKTTNKLLAIADAAIEGTRDEYIRQLHDLRDFHSREARQVVPAGRSRRARPLPRRPFPGAHRTGQGPRRARRTDAALHRRHFQLRRAPLQLHRHAGLPPLRHGGRRIVDSRDVIVTDQRHTQAAPLLPRDLRAPGRDAFRRSPQSSVVVMGGFIGSTEDGVTTTLGRGGIRLHRLHRRRRHRRRRDPDLDRRGRHAHRRPHHPARRPSRQDHLLRRSRRTGLFRRQGAAPGHRRAGHRKEHPGADSELAPAGSRRHAHHRRSRALRQRGQVHRLQAQDHHWSTSTPRAC